MADYSFAVVYCVLEPPTFPSFYILVGSGGFEPAASRPPDVHSNRAELHPELTAKILSKAGYLVLVNWLSG